MNKRVKCVIEDTERKQLGSELNGSGVKTMTDKRKLFEGIHTNGNRNICARGGRRGYGPITRRRKRDRGGGRVEFQMNLSFGEENLHNFKEKGRALKP